MSLVVVKEGEHPYAYLKGNESNRFMLGRVARGAYPVNLYLARAQAVAGYAHNAFESTLSLLERKAISLDDSQENAVVVALLISNLRLPKILHHDHPKYANRVELPSEKYPVDQLRELTKQGIGWTAEMLADNYVLYGEAESAVFALALANFHKIIRSIF